MLLIEILSKEIPNVSTATNPVKNMYWDEEIKPNKWRSIARGRQSNVFLHPTTNAIIKYIQLDRDYKSDPSYQFLRVCLKHQDNPYLPKIKGYKIYTDYETKHKILVIAIERLSKIIPKHHDLIKQQFNLEQVNSIDIKNKFNDITFVKGLMQSTVDNHLKQVLRLLVPLFKHYEVDMHLNNIMIRNDTQLVFIDPIYYK